MLIHKMAFASVLLGAAGLLMPAAAQSPTPPAPSSPAQNAPPPVSPDDTTVRCRSVEVTGSLAQRRRICMTIAEWRRFNARGNQQARDLVDTANRCGGGAACQNGS